MNLSYLCINDQSWSKSCALFQEQLQSTHRVQRGEFCQLPVLKMASDGILPTCFGNNAGSHYLVAYLPPAPGQAAAKGIRGEAG